MSRFAWMNELEAELRKGFKKQAPVDDEEMDGFTGGDEDGDEDGDEGEKRCPPMKKAAKPDKYPPSDNGETDQDEDEEASVHNPTSIEKKTKGGKVGTRGVRKSLAELLDAGTAEVVDASDVLGSLVKGIDTLAEQNSSVVLSRLNRLEKAIDMIGRAALVGAQQNSAMVKSLARDVEQLEAQPQARRAQVTAVQKGFDANKGAGPTIPSRGEVMKKAIAAVAAGKVDAYQVSKLERDMSLGGFDEVIWARINATE